MGARKRESYYSPLPFHAVRFTSCLFSLALGGVLAYFFINLKNDGFKLPWTLLIILVTSIFTLLWLTLSFCIHSCGVLSPLLSLTVQIPGLILWIIAFSLLTYDIYGTLAHACSVANWGNSTGVTVCSVYKTFFSVTLFALLSQIALIVLDVRARREQTRQGVYDRMQGGSKDSFKMDTFESTTREITVSDTPYGVDHDSQNQSIPAADAPIYRGRDNFYHNENASYQSHDTPYHESNRLYLDADRPVVLSREASSHRSTRSDAPMLNNYGNQWAQQQSAYHSPRYGSPHR